MLAAGFFACGAPDKPPSAPESPRGARIERDVDPMDLFPSDLDLVIRVDLARIRAGIGKPAADEIAKKAVADGSEDEVREALACAEVVWIGTRLTDFDAGDRVLVVEGHACMPSLLSARWERRRSPNARVRIFERTGAAPRGGTACILNLSDKATVFVSPVELDAVKRVLDGGPDEKRGAPSAEGIFSFDQRAGRLPPGLAKKYPSINEVLAGIERIRGNAKLVDEGVRVEAEVLAGNPEGAARAARFLEAMRDSLAQSARFGAFVKGAKVELIDKSIELRLTLPAKALLSGQTPPGDAANPPLPKGEGI